MLSIIFLDEGLTALKSTVQQHSIETHRDNVKGTHHLPIKEVELTLVKPFLVDMGHHGD